MNFKTIHYPALVLLSVALLVISPSSALGGDWGEWDDKPDPTPAEKPAPTEKPEPAASEEKPVAPEGEEEKEPEADVERTVKVVFSERAGFGLECDDFTLRVHTLLQTDLRFFEEGDFASNGFRFRRAYFGLEGVVESWLEWKCEYDLADPSGANASGLQDTYGKIRFKDLPIPIHINVTAGYFKPAVTCEEFRQPTRFITFMERGAHVAGMFPGRHVGIMGEAQLPGEEGCPPLIRGWLGLHNGNPGALGNASDNWGLSLMVEGTPLADKFNKILLQVGMGLWLAYYENSTSWRGISPDGSALFFPYDPWNRYDTGGLEQLHSLHVNFYYDRFAFMFEYTFGIQQRKLEVFVFPPPPRWVNLAPIRAQGFHLDACAMVWSPDGAPFRDIEFNRGLEVCMRIERYELNDARRGSARRSQASTWSQAPNVLGGRMNAWTIGCNWYVTRRVRASFNLQAQWFDLESQQKFYPARVDHENRTGGPRVVFLFRLQVFI